MKIRASELVANNGLLTLTHQHPRDIYWRAKPPPPPLPPKMWSKCIHFYFGSINIFMWYRRLQNVMYSVNVEPCSMKWDGLEKLLQTVQKQSITILAKVDIQDHVQISLHNKLTRIFFSKTWAAFCLLIVERLTFQQLSVYFCGSYRVEFSVSHLIRTRQDEKGTKNMKTPCVMYVIDNE